MQHPNWEQPPHPGSENSGCGDMLEQTKAELGTRRSGPRVVLKHVAKDAAHQDDRSSSLAVA